MSPQFPARPAPPLPASPLPAVTPAVDGVSAKEKIFVKGCVSAQRRHAGDCGLPSLGARALSRRSLFRRAARAGGARVRRDVRGWMCVQK